MISIEQFVGLHSQMNEIIKRVGNGSLEVDTVKDTLQAIIEKREPKGILLATSHQSCRSSWYVSVEQQLERVKQLNMTRNWEFEESDFPAIPQRIYCKPDEVLLLCVYLPTKGRRSGLHRTFDELWDVTEAPVGYTKWRWDELKATSKLLRQAPGYTYEPGIRWVIFNPKAYCGKRPEQALELAKQDNVHLAGLETLMAAMLFPDWASSWNGNSSPYPWLGGLQFKYSTDWSRVPRLNRWDVRHRLGLRASEAGHNYGHWSSPVIRECKN